MKVMLILGLLLFLVTVVGHGIWVFVAFVFRSLAEPTPPTRPVAPITPPKKRCQYCGALCAATFQNCPRCGIPVEGQPPSLAKHLRNLQLQADLLLAEEVLSLEQFETVRAVLQQAIDKFKPTDAETPDAELPTLEVADVVEPAVSDVGQIFNLPVTDRQVEILPHNIRSNWTDWLQAFLEEKNIRWGELLAGMLIVGSSVGLVISLWSTLRNAIPYFPALCFLAVTAAIHGAGLYTLRHWRLKTTSRGLLTIALLLVPLNFLAAIALSEQRSATDPLYLTAVVIGVVAYGWITWSGTRELMHFGAAWLSLAVLGCALGQLMIGRLTSAGLSTIEPTGLFALPLATYVVALLGTSQFAARWRRLSPRRVESLYRLLGIAFFSLAVALSLLLWKSQAVLDTLSRLSPCVSLAAAMVVGVPGRLLLERGVLGAGLLTPPLTATAGLPDAGNTISTDHATLENFGPEQRRGKETRAERGTTNQDIAATAVTLVGAMLMVVAVVLAWPDPERLIAVGVVNFLALSWFGFATGLASLHVPALASLSLAGLIAFQRFGQSIDGAGVSEDRNLIETMLLGRSGVVLALMSLLTVFVARFLAADERGGVRPPVNSPQDRGADAAPLANASIMYLIAAAGMAVLSLGIAGYAGFWPHVVQPSIDRSLPTLVFLLFGIAGMVANERLKRIEFAWAGAVVWLAVFLHGLGWNMHVREWFDGFGLLPSRPIVVALLSFATWSLSCAIVGKYRDRFVAPWSAASGRAIVVALFAMPWKVWGDLGPHAIYLGWVAAMCLGQAHLWQSRKLFSLSQAVAFLAASLGVASFAQHADWWIAHGNDVPALFDVRHGQWQITGLALACMPWVLWRRFGGRWAVLAQCSDWKLDRVLLPVLVILFAGQTWSGLWPGLGFEIIRLNSILSWRWDRVIAFLFGWGAVCWSVEEVTRSWFRRWCPSLPTEFRVPWLSELLTLLLAFLMFVWPNVVWSGAHHASLWNSWPRSRELYFGTTAWWPVAASVSVLIAMLLERRRWLPVAGLIVVSWAAVLQANVWHDQLAALRHGDNDIVTGLLWSLTGLTAIVMVGGWLVQKLTRSVSIEVAQFSAPKGAEFKSPGRSPGKQTAFKPLSPEGAKQNESHPFRAFQIPIAQNPGLRPGLPSFAPFGAENSATSTRTRRVRWRELHALAESAAGIALWLCLLPATVLMRLECEAWLMHARPLATEVGLRLGEVGTAFVCILPMIAWTILLIWQAARQRSATVMFGASHAWVLGFALIGLMMFYRQPTGGDVAALARLLQWSILGLGTFSLLWFWRRESVEPMVPSCFDRRLDFSKSTPWLWHQLWSWASLLIVSGIAAIQVFSLPFFNSERLAVFVPFGGAMSHLGVLVLVIAAWLTEKTRTNRLHSLGLALLAWVPLLAASPVANIRMVMGAELWKPHHVWVVGWLVLAVGWSAARIGLAIGRSPTPCGSVSSFDDSNRPDHKGLGYGVSESAAATLWPDAASIGVVVLALREFWFRESVAWSAVCVAILAANASVLAWMNRSQWRVAASMAYAVLATVMAWRPEVGGWLQRVNPEDVTWWEAGLISLGVAALAWQIVEVWWQRRRGERFDPVCKVAACRSVARVVLGAGLLFVFCAVLVHAGKAHRGLRDAQELFWNVHPLAGGLICFGVAMTFVVSAWDRYSKTTVAGLYGSIWLALLLMFESRALPMSEHWSVWAIGLMAADVAIVGAAWWQVKGSGVFFAPPASTTNTSLPDGGVKETPDPVTLGTSWRNRLAGAEQWISNAQLAWAIVASVLAIFGVLNFGDRSLRLWCVASAAVLVPGIAALASSRRRELFQRVALGLGAVWAVDCLWALMEPQPRVDFWLQRSIRALEALAVTAFVYGVGLVRVIRAESDWWSAVQRAARDAGVLAIVALMFVLTLEAWWFDPVNGAPVTGLQIALVAVVLVGLAVALLTMALTDGEFETESVSGTALAAGSFASPPGASAPPLSFTPQAFVYAAEVVVVLLFLHCYLTMPGLFRGYLQPYWPLIVMAIAFAGVGASELCQRAKLNVLSEPLQNSAALLPLIPTLGFWVATSRTDYSSVLFAAGLVYVWLNLRRRSFWYVLAASLAGNFGLWSLWSEHGVDLLVRPQVWLIPPAISVLAAAQWNRQRLTEAQLAAIRYPAITLLYVSSAGEMFLTGIAESFWLPVVLMVLSVSGVLAGIWLRVRAFLYLGASFLLLSLVSMVWHAAEAIDHTWPWWAFGIGLGLGVLTLFGLFERKRNEMLRLLGELRTWER